MLDGSEEGEVNALAITKFLNNINNENIIIYLLGKENISFREEKIKWLKYGVMMKDYAILLEQVIQELLPK